MSTIYLDERIDRGHQNICKYALTTGPDGVSAAHIAEPTKWIINNDTEHSLNMICCDACKHFGGKF